jgi:hypothetical protein
MKKISIAMFSIIAMAGVASAQGKGSAAGGAGVKVDAKVGAGAAKADAKAGAAAATPAMEMPKPPAEIAAALKEMGAHKNCTGTGMGGPDMKTEMKFKSSMNNKSDLGGWWIHMSMNGTMGEGKASGKFMMESYQTWDAKMGKWRISGVMNDGSNMAGTADMKDGKYESQADVWSDMGKATMKEHGDMTDKKVGMHMWGEMSMDGGKTWNKVYDMTCK